MLVINNPALTGQIKDPEIAALAEQRFAMLSEDEPYDPEVHGIFIVLETGDGPDTAEAALGFSALSNRYDGKRFGESDFSPSFEFIEEHNNCFEIVFVLSDDGYGFEVFVPKGAGTDANLLAMCRQYAMPSKEAPHHET
jgi:hypothetical protein